MDQAASKLTTKYGIGPNLAQALVDAGFDCPGAIRRASLVDLRKVRGVGPALAKRLKSK